MIKQIINKIEEYENIVIYRHVNPDYDAFGSQFGLYELITNSFVNKNVYVAGVFTSDIVKKCDYSGNYDMPDFSEKVLGIVLDTANKERIDGDTYLNCTELIKIDHHIVVDSYGDINYEDPTASSCSQLIGTIYQENQDTLTWSTKGAANVYMGIIGDTSRFLFSSTDERTFNIAGMLYQLGIDTNAIYQSMYLRKAADLKINKFILNNYQVDGNVAYYILRNDDLKELNISRERGSDYVNSLSQIEEYYIWMAITENVVNNNWRVSIRSRSTVINKVAEKYNGGGHAFASGATLQSLDELPILLKDLKESIDVQ